MVAIQVGENLRGEVPIVGGGIPVVDLFLNLAESTEDADAQTEIQGEILPDVEVILDIRLKELVADIVLRLRAVLGKGCDIAHEQIGEGISRGLRGSAVEFQIAAEIDIRHLIFLRRGEVAAKLEVVLAPALAEVVAVGISRV